MTARMDKTREALVQLVRLPPTMRTPELQELHTAALAEVEECEARKQEAHNTISACWEQIKEWRDRAEAAEAALQHFRDCADTPLMRDVLAERDRLKAALEQIVDESPHNFNARLIARAALGEQT